MNSSSRFYVARLAGTSVFDPLGDPVGRVRDVVLSPHARGARAVGMVVEVPGKRRVFLPITRITSIDAGQVIISGILNVRRFEKRSAELLVIGDLLDRTVTLTDGSGEATVEDMALDENRHGDWELSKLYIRRRKRSGSSLAKLMGGRGETLTVSLDEVTGLFGTQAEQSAALLLASYEDLKPADLGEIFQEIDPKRRLELAAELSDDRLADVLEELPEDTRVEMVTALEAARAADVLEEMDPDDAADVLAELPDDKSDVLLELMDPEESEPVRRLMEFSPSSVGALMTPEPIILPPQATVAEALAHARNPELPTSLASMVFVARPPQATPTGKYLGCVHLQKLLREPPSTQIGGILDLELPALYAEDSQETAARYFATYNLVCGPVLDADNHLLGAVAVDDLLDHLLPEDWREQDWRVGEDPTAAASRASHHHHLHKTNGEEA